MELESRSMNFERSLQMTLCWSLRGVKLNEITVIFFLSNICMLRFNMKLSTNIIESSKI